MQDEKVEVITNPNFAVKTDKKSAITDGDVIVACGGGN